VREGGREGEQRRDERAIEKEGWRKGGRERWGEVERSREKTEIFREYE
jgi:hypothetical protein